VCLVLGMLTRCFPGRSGYWSAVTTGAARMLPPVAMASRPRSISRSSATTGQCAQALGWTRDPALAVVGFSLAGIGSADDPPLPSSVLNQERDHVHK
jgi:hypothetical protein